MIDVSALRKAWALLDRRERRNAGIVLLVVSMAALGTAVMVGSILPFLTVLADPSSIRNIPQLDWAYETFGFGSSYAFLLALGFATLGVIVLSNALMLARIYVITRFSQMRIHALSRKLLGIYLSQPYAFFLDHHSGDMSTRILSEVDQTVNAFFRPFAEVVASTLTILAIVALLIWVNPAVAIGAFVVFGGTFGIVFAIIRRRLSELGTRRAQSNQKRFRTAKEVLGGIKEVKLHGHEDAYLHRFSTSSYNTMRPMMLSQLIGQIPRYFVEAVAFGGLVILCVLLLDPEAFGSGESTLQELLPLIGVVAFAAQRMMPELSKLYQYMTQMRFGAAALEALHSDMKDAASAHARPKAAPEPLGLTSELRLEGVTYRYPNAHRDSLSSISLTIKAGERIGIVGGTGAGKTTVADLVLGLLAPTEGRLLADGTEIDEANRRRWQQSLAYVPQEIFLVDATVAENIAFGLSAGEIDRDRVETAARIAQLDGFVRSELPDGYETGIGERGVRLSGGQRQRIGIARALYHGADLIVFDEATSALDNLTERDVMSAIDAVPGNKTILMIAHRLSTVQKCDRIVVLDQGRIVGVGTWEELIEQNPSFRELAAAA
jgi:ABC-type multidrug transport system fused ATPase/permease subunit